MGTTAASTDQKLPPLMFLSWRSPWLRALGGMLVIILILRLWMGYYWYGQMDQRMAALKAAGEPTRLEELHLAPLPKNLSDDPRDVIVQAGKLVVRTQSSPSNQDIFIPQAPPYDPQWWSFAALSAKANAPAMAMIRKSRLKGQTLQPVARPQNSTGFYTRSDRWFSDVTYGSRMLADELCDNALYLHLQGSSAEALEDLRDARHLMQLEMTRNAGLSLIVAIGIDAKVQGSLRIITPGLDWHDPAIRNVAMAFAREMADDQPIVDAVLLYIRSERVRLPEIVASADPGWLLRPLAMRQHVQQFDQLNIFQQGIGNPAIASQFGPLPRSSRMGVSTNVDYIDWQYPLPLRTQLDPINLILAERHATAISLAANAYHAQTGQWPADLKVLCPDYLPAVLNDSTRSDQGPMQYQLIVQNGRQRPLVWLGDTPFDSSLIPADEEYYLTSGPRGPFYRDISQWIDPKTQLPVAPVPPAQTQPLEIQ